MFIILVIFLTTVFANSYEKYIDLLPDEEKQEFLDHVARRVLENVESKEEESSKTKFSIELTDEQLKEHNDFVQAILKQESEQMRRRKADLKNKELNSAEELKVKPLREDVVSEKDEKSNSSTAEVTLTSEDAVTENSTVSNEETATQNVTIQKRSIQSEESDEKKLTSAETSTKFNDLTKIEPVPTVSSNADESTVTEAVLQGNFRRSQDASYSEESETTPNDVITTETRDDVITTTEAIETQISTTTTNSPEQTPQLDNSKNIGDSAASKGVSFRVEDSEEEATTQTNSNENSDEKSTNAETETTSIVSTLSSTLPESTTEGVTETTTVVFKAQTETTKSDINEEITSTTTASLIDTATTDNIIKENETATVNIDTQAIETTLEPILGVTPTVIEVDVTKKPTKSKSKLNKTKTVDNSAVLSDLKKVLDKKENVKEEAEDKSFALIQKDVLQKALDDHKGCGLMNISCNRYRVYEVHWPVSAENESPFLRSKKPIDSPFSVPIYNYSPNNAYYNPQNRRGPNSDENSVEQQQLREGQNSNGVSEFQINLDGLMSKFGKYNKNSDQDKLHELVNSLKAEDKPKGLETDHLDQYFRLKGGLKNKIRGIRDVLFKNKQLSDHKRLKKDTSNEVYKGAKDRDISMDYFYGRSKPNAEFEVINIPGKLDSEFLHSIFNGHDLLKVISVKKPIKKSRNRNIKLKKRNKNIKIAVENERKENLDYIRHKDEKSEIVAKNNDAKFESYMNALKELIVQDNNALKQYDWLSTTVQIHAALSKLIELVTRVQNSDPVHPADLQILKYITFLYNFATEIKQANHYGNKLRNNLKLPSNRKRKGRPNGGKEMINKVWLYLRTLMPDLTDQEGLANLKQVLLDVEDGLFDLHEAIKNIATVTKFKNQNWYKNLKDLYLSTEEKQLKEVLLHISFARLTDLVEFSCHNGVEEDFVEYMKKHRDIAKKTLEEVLFVIKITDEINNDSV